jgi:hypothetical protein
MLTRINEVICVMWLKIKVIGYGQGKLVRNSGGIKNQNSSGNSFSHRLLLPEIDTFHHI